MDKFIINHSPKLQGDLFISGSKNATLPIMAATLLSKGTYILSNVPDLKDVHTMCKVLNKLGCETSYNKLSAVLKIDSSNVNKTVAPYELVKTMRASVLVLGPLLATFGKADVSLPGGCAIGTRPVNIHIEGLKKLGADVHIEKGYISCSCKNLRGTEINLDFPSVGATENIVMAAVTAEGTTVIINAAKEPEITDLCCFLNKMGAKINGAGTNCLTIEGTASLTPASHSVIPDRIEAGTYLIAGALTKGKLTLKNIKYSDCIPVIDRLTEIGVHLKKINDTSITVESGNVKKYSPLNVKTMPHPGFPTDMQAQFMVLLSLIPGVSIISETVFENRFMHISELLRLGADIKIDGHTAIVKGVNKFNGTRVMATDLRASAALVLAGLAAEGTTELFRVYHIDRGYEHIEEKLTRIGASILRSKAEII